MYLSPLSPDLPQLNLPLGSTMPCSRREAHATPRTHAPAGGSRGARGREVSAQLRVGTRRRIRHAAALAHELGTIHSFQAYGVV